MNWKAVSDDLRKSAADAQGAANRYAVAGERNKMVAADTEASILRALARALEVGGRS